jgi:MscS family membrane protein
MMLKNQKSTFTYCFIGIFILLCFSINLFGENLLTKDNNQSILSQSQLYRGTVSNEITPYDLGFIISLIKNNKSKSHTDQNIEKFDQEMKKIIENINKEVLYLFDTKEYEKEMKYLNSKININSKYDNNLAVSRDILKIAILDNKKRFAQTINSIIDGKNSFKDKKYFITLFNNIIETLNKIDLSQYKKTASLINIQSDPVSLDFKNSLNKLNSQIKANLFVYDYLKSNMDEYRPSNLILDKLSLKYIINKIDSNSYIKNISEIFNYYLHISIGKIVILILIFALFFTINKKLFPFFTKKLSTRIKNSNVSILEILPPSFSFAISIIMYVFALQISLFLLIENVSIVNRLVPWFNTIYLAFIAYMFYRVLNNYINFSSDKIFSNHPNMRKEMVDFILRILKVVIFLFLLLFLLVQLDFDIKAIIASLGIGGIAIALAAKDTLSNFFGSLNIITDNSFSQGDWIEAENVEGTVVDIRMRTTRIRTFANAMITVPNAQLANMSILNWSKRAIGRRIKMSIGITYGSKMSNIENLVLDIRDMLHEHSSIASTKLNIDKKPYLLKREDLVGIKNTTLVYIDEYASSSINILVYCFSKSPNWEEWLETKQDVIVKISQLVVKNNCSFAFPTQTIHLENGEALLENKKEEKDILS